MLAVVLTVKLGALPETVGAGTTALPFWPAFEISIAMPLSWLPLISDYTREAKRPVAGTVVSAAVYTLVSIWMYALGILLVRRRLAVWNLAVWLIGTLTYHFAGSSPIGPTLTSLLVAGILTSLPLAMQPSSRGNHMNTTTHPRESFEVAKEYYREAMKAIVNGETDAANTMFRDLVNAGIGFQRLARETGISAPNLHRTLSSRGNPTMRTFGKIAASISAFLGFQTPMAVFS